MKHIAYNPDEYYIPVDYSINPYGTTYTVVETVTYTECPETGGDED